MITLYDRGGGVVVQALIVDDTSYRYRALMGDNVLTLYFSLPEHLEVPVGSWCEFQGERYTLQAPEDLKMQHRRAFEYTLKMQSAGASAGGWMFRNPIDGRLEFPLTAQPQEHLQMIVDNLNAHGDGGSWSVGECITGVEKLVNYSYNSCLDALSLVAEAFETEYEINGRVVSLRKVEYNADSPLPLSYGRGHGFKSGVGRTSTDAPLGRLYIQGGDRNIDPSKYPSKTLLLPSSGTLGYDGEHFSDESGYDTSKGRMYRVVDGSRYSIERVGAEGTQEASLDCTEIYPSREGTVSALVVVDESKNFYDFTDDSIPDTLNYNDYQIVGETMTVIFQSGMLAGREFDVIYHPTATGSTENGTYKAGKRFEIVPQELDGYPMPDVNTGYVPAVGDKYAIFHCNLPTDYFTDTTFGAEWKMMREAVKYLYENEGQKYTFTGTLDGIWAREHWEEIRDRLKVGSYIAFSDNSFCPIPMLLRIKGIKDYVNSPHSPEIEISNESATAGLLSLLRQIENRGRVQIAENYRRSEYFTKRTFRDAKQTMTMLSKALLKQFTESISPVSVQTMQMLLGDESLQVRFVKNFTDPINVDRDFAIYYDKDTHTMKAHGGTATTGTILQHLTLDINTLSSRHSASEYHFWPLPAWTSEALNTDENKDKSYYLYAVCPKDGGTGALGLYENAREMDAGGTNYNFLLGIVNSADEDGQRSFVSLYGFTEILPGQITTERIVSANGQSYFDMRGDSLKLGDKLSYNVDGDGVLRIKGTIVQSQGGAESYIGCFRGPFQSSYTYYEGDEVTYTTNGLTSTYRFIGSSPARGVYPTSSSYWQVIAAGSRGADGIDGVDGTDGANGRDGKDGADGRDGNDGADAPYYEMRYAVNGSTTSAPSLSKTSLEPLGWSTVQPAVGSVGEYLWMTTAKKSADGQTLLEQWSTPIRVTPYDGKDGQDGKQGPSPVLVFRGNYDASATYYGTDKRLDCVKYGETYYIARIDAGEFSGVLPTNTGKWNSFGASFESVATKLLLAEHANIGDWYLSDGKIVSTIDANYATKVILDALNNQILLQRGTRSININAVQPEIVFHTEYGGTQSDAGIPITLQIDGYNGKISMGDNDARYHTEISPDGIYVKRAGVDADHEALSWGYNHRASIVGLGYGNVAKGSTLAEFQNLVAGIYGRAQNSGTAPAFGGYFTSIYSQSLTLGIAGISNSSPSSTWLPRDVGIVIGVGTSGTKTVYLPTDAEEGQIIRIIQVMRGTIRVDTDNGEKIYDDQTENDYFNVYAGATLECVRANWTSTSAWVVRLYATT